MPTQIAGVKTGWLAYPIIIKKNSKIERREMQIFFERNNVQTRTIFTGNILRQPLMKNLKYKSHKNTALIADDVMKNGILLGCHQALSKNDLKRMCDLFLKFAKTKGI